MTDTTTDLFATASQDARPLHIVARDGYAAWRDTQPAVVQAWLDAQAFDAAPGALALLPGDGGLEGAVIGIGGVFWVVGGVIAVGSRGVLGLKVRPHPGRPGR